MSRILSHLSFVSLPNPCLRLAILSAIKARFASGANRRWRAAWGCFVFLRRLALMRGLAADMAVHRTSVQLQVNAQVVVSHREAVAQ